MIVKKEMAALIISVGADMGQSPKCFKIPYILANGSIYYNAFHNSRHGFALEVHYE